VSGADDPYVYPGTRTLKNRLGIADPEQLERVERRLSVERSRQGVPAGNFDLAHLQAIHRHLFQDIYDWAGEIRTVEISKGAQQFQFRQYIHTGMADVHRRLARSRFLGGLSRAEFAKQAAVILGDVNFVHPFREGNGGRSFSTSSCWPRRQAIGSTLAVSTPNAGLRPRRLAMLPTMT
jgi:cell filamentation protein